MRRRICSTRWPWSMSRGKEEEGEEGKVEPCERENIRIECLLEKGKERKRKEGENRGLGIVDSWRMEQ